MTLERGKVGERDTDLGFINTKLQRRGESRENMCSEKRAQHRELITGKTGRGISQEMPGKVHNK